MAPDEGFSLASGSYGPGATICWCLTISSRFVSSTPHLMRKVGSIEFGLYRPSYASTYRHWAFNNAVFMTLIFTQSKAFPCHLNEAPNDYTCDDGIGIKMAVNIMNCSRRRPRLYLSLQRASNAACRFRCSGLMCMELSLTFSLLVIDQEPESRISLSILPGEWMLRHSFRCSSFFSAHCDRIWPGNIYLGQGNP
jgi:hypothetical protein